MKFTISLAKSHYTAMPNLLQSTPILHVQWMVVNIDHLTDERTIYTLHYVHEIGNGAINLLTP